MAFAAPWEGELVEGTAMICRGIEMGSAMAKFQRNLLFVGLHVSLSSHLRLAGDSREKIRP